MQNILLSFCRKNRHYTQKEVAIQLEIGLPQYRELERGDTVLTHELAGKLSKLYNTEKHYFIDAARLLELMHTGKVAIMVLKADNDRLRDLLKGCESLSS